ncbi:MAG: hypothetical protein K8F59_15790 [Rhodobacteraceae bacterium]|nr:hypothetical protein [Paracoccaceae bacterium]
MSKLVKIVLVLVILGLGAGGAYFWSQGQSGEGSQAANSMTIQFGNNSYDALKSVRISPAGADAFVDIPLPNGTLGAGEFYAHTIADGRTICNYDLHATKEKGPSAKFNNVNLCEETFYHFEDVGYE